MWCMNTVVNVMHEQKEQKKCITDIFIVKIRFVSTSASTHILHHACSQCAAFFFFFYYYFFASSIYCRKSHSCFCIHQSDAQFLFTTPLQCVPEDVPGFPLCHISLQTWCISWRKTWCSSAWEHAQRAPCKTERQKILEHNEFKLCVNLN